MENPTFPRAYNLFKSLKANVIPCEVDKSGIRIDTINNDPNTKLIYTTPSNQYPLGIKMSKDSIKKEQKCYYCTGEGLYFDYADYKRISVCKNHLNMEASS